MLVLTRKPNETIVIGRDASIKIKVLSVRGYQVRIGIEAPRDVEVHREEIFLRLAEDKQVSEQITSNLARKQEQQDKK